MSIKQPPAPQAQLSSDMFGLVGPAMDYAIAPWQSGKLEHSAPAIAPHKPTNLTRACWKKFPRWPNAEHGPRAGSPAGRQRQVVRAGLT